MAATSLPGVRFRGTRRRFLAMVLISAPKDQGRSGGAGISGQAACSNLYMGTAALSQRDWVHEAIDQADLIISIGHNPTGG